MATKKKESSKSSKKKATTKNKTSGVKRARDKLGEHVESLSQEAWCAALSYIFIGLVWFAIDETIRKSNFVKFHVKQALIILIVGALINVTVGVLIPFSLIPVVGIVFSILMAILGLAQIVLVVFMVIGIVNSFVGNEYVLPFVGDIAKKLRF